MPNPIIIKDRITKFNKKITVSGDKSLSIRWVLFSSLANGVSKAKNLLISEDVLASINAIRKLGIKVKLTRKLCKVYGKGIDGYKYRKNLTINAENSGTLGRLILGLLINASNPIKLIGDKSLSKRDFKRISDPLSKFGADFKLKNSKNLPLTILGSSNLKPIKYFEKKGSAQCKSAVIFGGMRTDGTTLIKAKKSRNHSELLCKYLNLPIKIQSKNSYDVIKIKKVKKIKTLNYNIPSDISSSAFFIVLTALSKNSSLLIKNININPSRTGIITILKKMGVKIILKNKKIYKGEKNANIFIQSSKKLKSINCPKEMNSRTIDEFLLIFLSCSMAKGVSRFKGIGELRHKETDRLKFANNFLNRIGIKTKVTKDSLNIYGNPNLKLNKTYKIKNFDKDHRICMMSIIAALTLEGKAKFIIHDLDSIKTSFPNLMTPPNVSAHEV